MSAQIVQEKTHWVHHFSWHTFSWTESDAQNHLRKYHKSSKKEWDFSMNVPRRFLLHSSECVCVYAFTINIYCKLNARRWTRSCVNFHMRIEQKIIPVLFHSKLHRIRFNYTIASKIIHIVKFVQCWCNDMQRWIRSTNLSSGTHEQKINK